MADKWLSPEHTIGPKLTEQAAKLAITDWLRNIDNTAPIIFIRNGQTIHGSMTVPEN